MDGKAVFLRSKGKNVSTVWLKQSFRMQAQAHVSSQVSGEAGGQLSGSTQLNGSNLPSRPSGILHRLWHADNDVYSIRQYVVEKIWQRFQRHQLPQERQQRLRNFAKRLEEGLYKEAASKEEYMDLNTLEQRLQALVKRTAPSNRSQSFVQHVSSSMGTMIPTPGMPSTGNGTSMKATVGMNPVGMGSMLPASNGSDQVHSNSFTAADDNSNRALQTPILGNNIFSNSGDNLSSLPVPLGNMLQSQQGIGAISMAPANHVMPTIGMPGVRSQMIPTPGLPTSQSVPTKVAASGGIGSSNADCIAAAQHQQFNGGQNNHIYHNISGQMSGTMGSNMQRKNYSYGLMNGGMNGGMQLIGNNPHLMSGTTALCNPGGYLNASQYGNMQTTSQQHVTQQRQQHFVQSATPNQMTPLARDGYAMNAADLAGTGNFYNATSSAGFAGASNLNGNSLGLQSAKMIPVPGLPQQKLQAQQQTQQNQSQGISQSQQLSFPHGSSVLSRGQSLHAESPQQQQLQFQQHHPQHPQQQHLLEQPSYHQYQEPQNQQQMQQGQQQQLSLKRKGIQLNQPELTPFGQKQVGFESLQDTTSQQEMSEQSQFSLPPGQQQHLPAKEQQVQQSPLFQVHHISSNAHQSNPQQSQKLQEVQVSSPQEQKQTQSQIDPNDLARQVLPEAGFQGEKESQPQEKVQPTQQGPSLVQQQQPLYGQVGQSQEPGQDKAQQRQLPPQVSASGMVSSVASQTRVGNGQPSGNAEARQSQYIKQQRWLLFLRHASKCSAAEGQCQTPHCSIAQQLWAHITKCHDRECAFPRCRASRTLLGHHQRCHEIQCPVCGPVRHLIMQQRAMLHVQSPNPGINSDNTTGTNVNLPSRSGAFVCDTAQIEQPPLKRAKVEPASPSCAQQQAEITSPSVPNPSEMPVATLTQSQVCLQSGQGPGMAKSEAPKSTKSERTPVKMEVTVSSLQGVCQKAGESNKETCVHPEAEHGKIQGQIVKAEHFASASSNVLVQVKQEPVQLKQESMITVPPPDNSASAKLGKPKIKGVSLTELFTPEQIREHITGLRQWVGQSKAKAEKNQAMEHQMSENSCQLCAVEKLTFEPPPIYCTRCGVRIKRNSLFYTVGSGETRHYFCIPCYNSIGGDTIKVDGMSFGKSRLEKRKNDEETEEAWVSCDKCDAWQHQICALFNGRRNEGGQAEYTCPNCYTAEIEKGERRPLPQSAVLGAKDLPRTYLSDHIEQRLSQQLKQEKQERARALGKSYEEVPGAEGLVVRVVSSVDKKLEVKQLFLEIFQHEDYPTEYPYKSKVLLLFQKIEGVEVCLFGMYVQEFGSECSLPNQRRIYLSYLDSVKYFRPDVKTVTGEALRTFVYHEILIGYLEYCKKRGLTSCYIWACPPLKGEDYILYCHPEIQKTPKSDKLREWYLTMLRKACKENIVVDMTNLYDYFFVPNGDCKTTKVTAARLPYFDGDYLPGAAEDVIMHFQQEEEEGRKHQKTKKAATKRSSKAAAQAEPASNASKDALLMQKLGESIHPMKEDFIMVHLQHACAHCRLFIVSGKRWVCSQCKNFQLCDKCYEADQNVDERERHPINSREKHMFSPIEVKDVPADTRDKDDIMESEFFDTRQAFLSLCQGNHYQYDTLRRAKHSSMMVLYHLHNPTAPAFVTTCNMCHRDIETGQGWRCETCPDFDICNDCYHKDDSVKHPHKLTAHPSMADRDAQNKEARQQRVLQLRKMLDLLAHASQCCSAQCLYPNCRRVKGLFRHGMQCRTRASGGCPLCKKMWHLLQLHARACKESECRVPRCKDLKEHLRRLQHQMESRRRAAVMEMMRQRAAEVAGKSH